MQPDGAGLKAPLHVKLMHSAMVAAIGIYLIVLIAIQKTGYVPLFQQSDFLGKNLTATALMVVLSFIAIVDVIIGIFLPRWMLERYPGKVRVQRLLMVEVLRVAFLQAVAIFGLILGIMGAGWVVAAVFFAIPLGVLVKFFPTDNL